MAPTDVTLLPIPEVIYNFAVEAFEFNRTHRVKQFQRQLDLLLAQLEAKAISQQDYDRLSQELNRRIRYLNASTVEQWILEHTIAQAHAALLVKFQDSTPVRTLVTQKEQLESDNEAIRQTQITEIELALRRMTGQ